MALIRLLRSAVGSRPSFDCHTARVSKQAAVVLIIVGAVLVLISLGLVYL